MLKFEFRFIGSSGNTRDLPVTIGAFWADMLHAHVVFVVGVKCPFFLIGHGADQEILGFVLGADAGDISAAVLDHRSR